MEWIGQIGIGVDGSFTCGRARCLVPVLTMPVTSMKKNLRTSMLPNQRTSRHLYGHAAGENSRH